MALGLPLVLLVGLRWPALPSWLAGLNLVTLCAYAYDKRAARAGAIRLPERTLHGLALLGGSPGALLGQKIFRHKTSKPSFQRVFILITVMQIGAALWWWAAMR